MYFSSFCNVSNTNTKTMNTYFKLLAVCEFNSDIEMSATKISLRSY